MIPPRRGELIGDSADRRVEILSDDPSLNATWSRFGPGREGADLHVHRRHTDLFYVLEGEFTLRLGLEDEQVTAAAGQLVRVPPMVVHGFRNASDADVTLPELPRARAWSSPNTCARSATAASSPTTSSTRPPRGCDRRSQAVIGEPVAHVPEIEVEEVRHRAGRTARIARSVVSLYVLEGEAAGTWVQIPPGTTHPRLQGRHLEIHTPIE